MDTTKQQKQRHDDPAPWLLILARCVAYGALFLSSTLVLIAFALFIGGHDEAFEFLRSAGIALGVAILGVTAETHLEKKK